MYIGGIRMSNEITKVLISFPDELLKRIEDYRFENRVNNRTQAVLDLIIKGLEKEQTE